MAGSVHLPGLDLPFSWRVAPQDAEVGPDALSIVAGPRTDIFADPAGGPTTMNAPALLTALPDGDHQLSARVTVDFRETFDAGVLLVWAGEDRSAKLCFERSPAGQPMVVSVVTRGRSDDANATTVDGERCWLRISTIGPAIAFHASPDGRRWDLVRYFDLGAGARPSIGFQAQSPMGEGCRVTFDHLTLHAGTLEDLRDGS